MRAAPTARPLIPLRPRGAALALVALLAAPALQAQPQGLANQATLARAAALPALDLGAPPGPGWSLQLDLSSEYVASDNGSERLLLDGETHRLGLGWRGVAGTWDWRVELPVYHLGGGFLDAAIDGWHDSLGLPDGGRRYAPQSRYRYRYERDGAVLFDLADGGVFVGDLRLGGGRALGDAGALRAELKLPSGDAAHLTGGSLGGALWLESGTALTAALGGYLAAGVSASRPAGPLDALQKTAVPFGGLGLRWRLTPASELLLGLLGHAPLYADVDSGALRKSGLQFNLGWNWCYAPDRCVELGFQEDPVTRSTPDFTLHLGWRGAG